MFYNFKVILEYRDFLRFFWYEDNDFKCLFIEYCMIVYVFGNGFFFFVVIYGFRKLVELFSEDVKEFINNNFYVDDGLLLCNSEEEVISFVFRIKDVFNEGGKLRFYKFVLNS